MFEILGEVFVELILEGFVEIFSSSKIPLAIRIVLFSIYVLLFSSVVALLAVIAVKEKHSGVGILAVLLGVLFFASFIYIGRDMWKKEHIS